MRKQILFLSFVVVLLTAFSTFAWSYYHSSSTAINEKTVCCNKPASSETIFESLVKQFVGAVKL